MLRSILKNEEWKRFAQFFLIVLVLSDIILLTIISIYPVNDAIKWYVTIFDLFVVLILIPEFIIRFQKAESKKKFLKYNGIDIFGMIPEILIGPYASVFRYIRLIRVIKIMSLFKMQIRHILVLMHKTKIDYGIFIVAVALMAGTIIFYIFEVAANPNINSFDDSLWFLVVTITTVGYGDILPMTDAGRIIGTLIIVIGIGFVSFITATITSIFIKSDSDEKQKEIDELHVKLDKMQLKMENEMNELKKLIKEEKNQ